MARGPEMRRGVGEVSGGGESLGGGDFHDHAGRAVGAAPDDGAVSGEVAGLDAVGHRDTAAVGGDDGGGLGKRAADGGCSGYQAAARNGGVIKERTAGNPTLR